MEQQSTAMMGSLSEKHSALRTVALMVDRMEVQSVATMVED